MNDDQANDAQITAQIALAADFTDHLIWRTKRPDGTPDCWAATPNGAGILATVYARTPERLRELLAGDHTIWLIYARLAEDFPAWTICCGDLGWIAVTAWEGQTFVTYADHALELRAKLTATGDHLGVVVPVVTEVLPEPSDPRWSA